MHIPPWYWFSPAPGGAAPGVGTSRDALVYLINALTPPGHFRHLIPVLFHNLSSTPKLTPILLVLNLTL